MQYKNIIFESALLTAPVSAVWRVKAINCWAISTATRVCASTVLAPRWGVLVTCGCCSRAVFVGGSCTECHSQWEQLVSFFFWEIYSSLVKAVSYGKMQVIASLYNVSSIIRNDVLSCHIQIGLVTNISFIHSFMSFNSDNWAHKTEKET